MTNYIAQYHLTDSNYKFMKEVSGQTETKVIHKSGNKHFYLTATYSALAQMTKYGEM